MTETTTSQDLRERMAQTLYEDTGCSVPWLNITTDPDFAERALTWRGRADAVLEGVVQSELDRRDAEIARLSGLIPECNGMCMTGADVGVPEAAGIAYPHPNCPEHGDPDAELHAAYQRAEKAEAKVANLLHDMATVARHIEDGEYGDADKAARQALGIAPGVDLPGRES